MKKKILSKHILPKYALSKQVACKTYKQVKRIKFINKFRNF